MSIIDELEREDKKKSAVTADAIRDRLIALAKEFKTSWVEMGQALYPVYQDKLYYNWGYEKFEYYVDKELGIKKSTAVKLLKAYLFIEQHEPSYLGKEFALDRDANVVPGCDEVNVLRLARAKSELTRSDFEKLKRAAFEKGRDASALRKDLVALMKERKPVDPEEERELRSQASLKKLLNAVKMFQKDMEVLKLVPADLLEETKTLLKRLEEEVG